jgi:peptidoglycan/xylan/chitin deacetylase (PgdA/CDA1 family)
MKKTVLAILVLFIFCTSAFAQHQICITMDDLPSQKQYTFAELQRMTTKILATLQQYQVPAIGFVNEGKLYEQNRLVQVKANLLKQWLAAGMELGNHTFSHIDYNNATLADYTADLKRGEAITKSYAQVARKPYRYFRHPYLHRGNTAEKVEALATYLKQQGYIEAPVTMDNGEWIFAHAYHLTAEKRDTAQMLQIGRDYIAYMEAKTAYYEAQSQSMFGRNIKHTLLIHANLLNAEFLDDLLAMFQKRGYSFISLQEALTDPAYQSNDTFVGNAGISWLHRWAITAQKPKEFFKGEPNVPSHILQIAGIESE